MKFPLASKRLIIPFRWDLPTTRTVALITGRDGDLWHWSYISADQPFAYRLEPQCDGLAEALPVAVFGAALALEQVGGGLVLTAAIVGTTQAVDEERNPRPWSEAHGLQPVPVRPEVGELLLAIAARQQARAA